MKILITYYSNTGNTEKVAKAIKEGLKEYNVELLPIKEADPTSLLTYDLMFLGSGIYAFNINRKVTRFINKVSKLPSKIVYFYTYSSPTPWSDAFNSIKERIEQEACEIVGVFECRGEYLKEIKGKGLKQ